MINVLCLFLLHFTIFQKQSALESKYVNATTYIDFVIGERTTQLIKTLEINYKYQLKSYLVQKSNLNSTWDLTY